MTEVTTTLVVNFQAGTAADVLQAEIDSREDGLNLGKTRFGKGDQPGYLVFTSANVVLTSQTPSAGVVQTVGIEDILQEETLRFAEERQASVSKPVFNQALSSFKWIGNDLGTPTVVDAKTVSVPTLGVGVLKVTYLARSRQFRLTNIAVPLNGETEFEVLILIKGETT